MSETENPSASDHRDALRLAELRRTVRILEKAGIDAKLETFAKWEGNTQHQWGIRVVARRPGTWKEWRITATSDESPEELATAVRKTVNGWFHP